MQYRNGTWAGRPPCPEYGRRRYGPCGQPGPALPGEPGTRLLVTVLASRTIPLIRYELTDRLVLAPGPVPCDLPFRLAEAVEGRTDDALTLPAARGGTIAIHPVVFHKVLDLLDTAGWQVRQEGPQLRILIAGPASGLDPAATERDVRTSLAAAGAATLPVQVQAVDAIPAGASGKRPLVVAEQAPGTMVPDAIRDPGPAR